MLFFILGWYFTPFPFPGLILFVVAVAVLQVSGHACYQVGAGPSSRVGHPKNPGGFFRLSILGFFGFFWVFWVFFKITYISHWK